VIGHEVADADCPSLAIGQQRFKRTIGVQGAIECRWQRLMENQDCTEVAVAAEALDTLAQGVDRYLKLGEGSPFFDIVLPCGGGLTLSLHTLRDRQALAEVLSELAHRRPARDASSLALSILADIAQ